MNRTRLPVDEGDKVPTQEQYLITVGGLIGQRSPPNNISYVEIVIKKYFGSLKKLSFDNFFYVGFVPTQVGLN